MDSNFWKSSCRPSYANCASAFSPSGVLVKAVILHSGQAVNQYFDTPSQTYKSLGAPPDARQGYGRVKLANVLPLPNVYTGIDLYVADQVQLVANTAIKYTVTVSSNAKPLK